MTYSQMFSLADQAKLSPERLGKLLGVSGMTLRRWKKMPKDRDLPPLYERAFAKGIEKLVVDGLIDPNSDLAQETINAGRALSFQATLKTLGVSDSVLERSGDPNEALLEGISQIAAAPARMKEVEDGKQRILAFGKKMGGEWKRRIEGVWNVVRSSKLTTMDKLVAYGALFYLITPFDLIPDSIPVFGLLDDFAILGLALAYYNQRFPKIVQAPSGDQATGGS